MGEGNNIKAILREDEKMERDVISSDPYPFIGFCSSGDGSSGPCTLGVSYKLQRSDERLKTIWNLVLPQ
jgi:hypothetical protein